jgi:hypothetical protein
LEGYNGAFETASFTLLMWMMVMAVMMMTMVWMGRLRHRAAEGACCNNYN